MISTEEIFPIGQLVKPHGVNGEMSFSFTTDIFNREEIEFFIFEIDGIYVPFFIDEFRFKSDSTGLIKFNDISTDVQARELSGLSIYISKKYIDQIDNTEMELDYFVGFTLHDLNHGEIGVISEIDQTTENALFVIETSDDELLIPVGEDYIVEIDHDNKRIHVDLPEGLLDLQ